jgi:hypothetical protein
MRPLRSARSFSLRAWAEGPIIDRWMIWRSFSRIAGSLPAICMTARSIGSCSGFCQFRSICRTSCSPSSARGVCQALTIWSRKLCGGVVATSSRFSLEPSRIAISSTGGIVGQEFCSAYSASKFGLEGWIESLAPEVAPFGIHTMVVEPGFFRTDLLTPESTTYAEPSIEDYAQRTPQTVASWTSMNGKQGGDPVKLADVLIKLVSQDEAPVRWVAGADAVQTVGNKGRDLIAQADAYRDLSSSLAHNDD